jgi:hypothetical protein
MIAIAFIAHNKVFWQQKAPPRTKGAGFNLNIHHRQRDRINLLIDILRQIKE